jgi:phosphotransferase system enzyme I (PtsI)
MCGEMAGEPRYILILLGLALDELSMNPLAIPRVKRIVREMNFAEARALVDRAMQLRTAKEVEDLLRGEMTRRFPRTFSV